MSRCCFFVLAVAAGSMTAFAETTTIVVPVPPNQDEVLVELAPHGIDPAEATVSGALRGAAEIDGAVVRYELDPPAFQKTMFDVFRVEGSGTALNVAVVHSRYDDWLGAQAGATATLDPGWESLGDVVWDDSSGVYVVTEEGELTFDFERDSVPGEYPDPSGGGQGGSGTLLELKLPPPPPPNGDLTGEPPILLYQGGGPGGEVWSLWAQAKLGRYDFEVVLANAAGEEVPSGTVEGPPGAELTIRLNGFNVSDSVELDVTSPDGLYAYAFVPPPSGFGFDRTWHRFGYLGSGSEEPVELDSLLVSRSAVALERQLVALDDFEAGSWASTWSSPAPGALRVGLAGAGPISASRDHVLVANLDQAQVVGPDYLVRSLTVPRAVMACRFDLDASSLTSLGPDGVKVFALLDESQQPPQSREYARLLVRHYLQPLPEIRLVTGRAPVSATPWIPLEDDAATIEVQWQKTQADGGRLDLWIDGCGPDPQACPNGWELQGSGQPGLVTAVQLGAVGGLPGDGGVLSFDDVACAGDSWLEQVD